MQIDLPEDVVEFMQNLATEITNQDCRATRAPYFYVVQGQEERPAPAGYGDVKYYVAMWEASYTPEQLVVRIAEWNENNPSRRDHISDVDEFIRDNCQEYSPAMVTIEENAFLTFKAYKEHMELNRHNYRHLENVHSYIKYAHRNPEMEKLHKAIMAFLPSDDKL